MANQMKEASSESELRKAHTNAHEFDLEELAQFFHLPINEVAVELGVCATVLKKICRKNGIKRWPHRKIKSIDTMVDALESVVPSSPEEQRQILADIQTLREKRSFLEKNPNASYKSVVPKYAINAYNARLQKSGGITKPAKKKTARNSPGRALPYKTRYRGTKSVPTYYFAEEEDRDAAVPDVSNARRSLITSQDEFAAAQLLQLKDINSGPTLLEVAKAAKTADMDVCAAEPAQEVPDESAELAHFVTTLPKMRFKRRWEQEHSPTKAELSAPSLAATLRPPANQQVPGWLAGAPKFESSPEWLHSSAVPSFGNAASRMALF